jgi:hypothetical protein
VTEGEAPPPRRWWWRLTAAALVAVVVLGAVTARVVVSGEREIAASTDALRAGDAHEATVRARRAAAWYAPGAPHVDVAYARLMALGREAEKRRRWDVAVLAFEGVREASIATRWLITPHAGDLEEAERAIARIRARDERAPAAATEPEAVIERQLLEALAARPGPSRAASATLGAAFLTWAGGLAWLLARAVDATGRLDRRRAWPALAVSALGVAAWIVVLVTA